MSIQSIHFLLGLFFAFGEAQAVTPDESAAYAIGDWHVEGRGNLRARVSVAEKSPAVWVHIPWRRRDANPEAKDIIVIEAASNQRVKNVLRVNVNREFGDLLFEPPAAPAEYFIYYMPYEMEGDWWFPTTRYLTPTNLAEAAWAAHCQPLARRIQQAASDGSLRRLQSAAAGIPQAKLLQIEAINDFSRFDPMEVAATTNEVQQLKAEQAARPYLVFPEDRTRPIRMRDELPLCWIKSGPSDSFEGLACRGEFFAFQLGVYAFKEPVENVQVEFSELVGSQGAVIPAAAMRCINSGGTDWLGRPFHKIVNVPSGKVQALWCGVMIPKNAPIQSYVGTATVRPKNLPPHASRTARHGLQPGVGGCRRQRIVAAIPAALA